MKTWVGDPPIKCDICRRLLLKVFVDGRTKAGPWAIMCIVCMELSGTGLGTGNGQLYVKAGDEWVKEA